VTRPHLPTRTLRERPDLDQLKRQAKELLDAYARQESAAVSEVNAHYHGADPATFALHDAQLVIARAYGFESWPKLRAFVDGATVRRLVDGVRAGDIDEVRALLKMRPELARMSVANFGVLHHAVLEPLPDMVRILMQHGANAREGVYPHREATTAYAIAVQRGYDEIVRIIEEEEGRRLAVKNAGTQAGQADALSPLDAEAHRWYQVDTARVAETIRGLLAGGAPMTAAAAVVLGDAEWLRARHAEGTLSNQTQATGGLLRIAITHDRPEILKMLLDFGFDPDERIRFTWGDDPAYSWGMALQTAVGLHRYDMAELLLERGADPNASIYASGDPMFSAYGEGDDRMIALLERYGGIPTAATAGLFRRPELARKMLAGEAPYRVDGAAGESIGEQLLWGAACGGDPEILRMALAHVDWPREDPRWFTMLEQTLRKWSHGSATQGWDESTYLTCFRLLLERCDPNLRGRPTDDQQFGLTTLHNIVARGDMSPQERVEYAKAILDAGARLDMRDNLLKSTPLGWACRWGQAPLVELFLERGADAREPDAEPWATPRAWAMRSTSVNIKRILAALDRFSRERAARGDEIRGDGLEPPA
jgi:hypothetical protein